MRLYERSNISTFVLYLYWCLVPERNAKMIMLYNFLESYNFNSTLEMYNPKQLGDYNRTGPFLPVYAARFV